MTSDPPTSTIALARRFVPYAASVRRPTAVEVSLVLASPLLGGALLWLLKELVDVALVGSRIDLLPALIGVYVAAVAAKLADEYAATRLGAAVSERITRDVRTDLYRHVLAVSPGSFGGRPNGDLLAHLTGDVDRVATLVHAAPVEIVADVASAVVFLGLLLVLSWKLTLLALLAVPPLALAIRAQSPRVKRAARVARRETSAFVALAEETLAALPLVQAFATEDHETRRFARRCDRARHAEVRTVARQAWLGVLVEGAATLGALVVLSGGAYLIHAGTMTLGAVIVFLGSIRSLYDPIRSLGQAPGRIQRAAASAQRVAALLDAPSAVREERGARPLVVRRGRIEFRNVSFAYPKGPPVLHDVSFTVEPGESLAVVGPSGSGKSTLIRLLLRLYDPAAGAILVDGADIRTATLGSLRAALAVVLQDPFVFHGSVAENLRYGLDGTPESAVVAAAVAAHAHDFILGLPGAYDAWVGPRGERMSGGQRQRIALARALARAAPILLLDEATASVDGETDELIQDAVARLAGRRTVLMIGHRLSTVRRASRVIVVEDGRVVEDGSTGALLRDGTRCHDLFAGQLAGAG